jgi:hypothetical protein
MADIKARGSGELLFQIKSRALSVQDLAVFATLLWAANSNGESKSVGQPITSVEQLIMLEFCTRIDADTVLLNPHIAQLGSTPEERGQLRKRFRQLVGA